VEFVKDKPIEVRFIEFMPFDSNDWNNKKLLPYFEIRKRIEDKYKLIRNEDGPNATSKVKLLNLFFDYLYVRHLESKAIREQ
jgi:molybdenum cofactor biosynthesis enzyme MoaA